MGAQILKHWVRFAFTIIKLDQNIKLVEGKCYYFGYGLQLKFGKKVVTMDLIKSDDLFVTFFLFQ